MTRDIAPSEAREVRGYCGNIENIDHGQGVIITVQSR